MVKSSIDRIYCITDTTAIFGDFVESKYQKYVDQNNVNKDAKNFYIRLSLGQQELFKKGSIPE